MSRRVLIALAAVALFAGCGSDDEATSEGEIQVALTQQSGSAQTGTATLSEIDESTTRVVIDITPAQGAAAQPAHIHRGDCVNLEKQPEYPLESVRDGSSTSEVNAPVDDLMGGGFAINVHKSDAEIDVYVACGEISPRPGAPEPEPGETETTEEQGGYGY